jgi:hypothetical protein
MLKLTRSFYDNKKSLEASTWLCDCFSVVFFILFFHFILFYFLLWGINEAATVPPRSRHEACGTVSPCWRLSCGFVEIRIHNEAAAAPHRDRRGSARSLSLSLTIIKHSMIAAYR